MTRQRFQGAITLDRTSAFIVLPFDPNAEWGARSRHYVGGSIAGHRIRGVLAYDGTQWCLPLGPAWRRDNAVVDGVRVEVVLEPEGPLLEMLAPDIAGAIAADPDARAFFESVAPFYRKNFIRWIETAKRPETRATRIRETVAALAKGEPR